MRREPDDRNDAVPEGKPSFEYRREGSGASKDTALTTAGVVLPIFFLIRLTGDGCRRGPRHPAGRLGKDG